MYDDTPSVKPMRPNDMCSASYYDDVAKLKELLTTPEVEEEPPLPEEFDPAEQPNPDGEDAHEPDPEEEEEEEKKERAAQRKQNAEFIEKRLSTPDVLTTRLSPVNVAKYGLHVFVGERDYIVTSKFKTSRKSTIAATPLHWAVLGRSHKAVAYLVSQGAKIDAPCPVLGVTPMDIAVANKSSETIKVMEDAKAKFDEAEKKKAEAKALLEKTIKERAEAVREHYKREAEEERLAAEREAAENGEEEAPEGGGGDDYYEDGGEDEEEDQ